MRRAANLDDVSQTGVAVLEGHTAIAQMPRGLSVRVAALLRYRTPQPDIKRYSRVTVRRF